MRNLIILFVLIISCNCNIFAQDKNEITNLVRQMYKWGELDKSRENSNFEIGFDPIKANPKDIIYSGIDWDAHKKRIDKLKQTGFFAKEFLENQDKIAIVIDKKMKNKSLKWLVDDGYPPFGNGANPWCDCQDNPDDYWKTIKIFFKSIDATNATLIWKWGIPDWDEESKGYKIKVTKSDGKWQIAYLQGYDFAEYVKSMVKY
jgi:hypothetical protein